MNALLLPFRFVRTVLGYLVIVVMTILFAPPIIVMGERADPLMHLWSFFVLHSLGIRVRTSRQAALDPNRSYIFVSNHTSHADVPAILATTPKRLRFVAKKELVSIPMFGPALARMGHVIIDRKDSHAAARSIRDRVTRGLPGGMGVLFFAEGTRSRSGELMPFKKGAAITALDAGLDIVPLAVAGAREVLPPGGLSLLRPGPVAVAWGAPIPTAGLNADQRDELVARSRAAVEACLTEAKRLVGSGAS